MMILHDSRETKAHCAVHSAPPHSTPSRQSSINDGSRPKDLIQQKTMNQDCFSSRYMKTPLFSHVSMMAAFVPRPFSLSKSTVAVSESPPFSLQYTGWKERIGWLKTVRSHAASETEEKTRIGVIGGGIAGVTVAYPLAKKLSQNGKLDKKYEIVVLEADTHSAASPPPGIPSPADESIAPKWAAATARNANSLVPAAAMHVFSRKSMLYQVIRDTIAEWYFLKQEAIQNRFSSIQKFRNHDFDVTPPYFALHLFKCLGPSVPSEERRSFINFVTQYLRSIGQGDARADERGRFLQKLATANLQMFLSSQTELRKKGYAIGSTRGFLSLHRTPDAAQHAFEEAKEHGEEATLLQWDEAVKQEPRLQNLPIRPLYAVRRVNDMISSCEEFARAWTEESSLLGVQFQNPCLVNNIEKVVHKHSTRPSYRVVCKDGTTQEFDVVVVAAGIKAPLLVSKLGASKFIPTYPLRGFSLTLFAWQQEERENLLRQPFSCDSMYCTSVTPWMARLAGFGEFIGYPKDDDVLSIGPSVLARYGRAVFPDAINSKPREVLSCFRPTSPDDVPIAGGIPSMPGLFVHNGHGTLGWTLGLATGECVAQEIAESLTGESEGDSASFELPNGFKVRREVLSPGRFGS